MSIQNYALRQLLDAEKARVVNEKEKLEFRLKTIEDKVTTMENEYKNQKNELINARLEASSWEKQLEKEREKLAKMKNEKKYLMDEVQLNGNVMVWKIPSFDQGLQLDNILEGKKPKKPALPWDYTVGRNNQIFEISKPVIRQKKQQAVIIVEKPLESPELRALLAKMEKKIVVKDLKIEELERLISEKTKNSNNRIKSLEFQIPHSSRDTKR
ncbi:hypothetical protein Phum_PHUM498300 [Pediculus humanus corporis]|uniref:Uncharacterized protein n=1 Tax=Pediculus humanus subsp. corporis TaxID=121224 RepID=E0VXC7_PEDHC|nr:uncharacterized protein Phum_PHUM498300 [Pediculus humanus corporis]EEB18033.1 hypothetical protein Phum_PHUM498300 [Pediculus humanus corporis]